MDLPTLRPRLVRRAAALVLAPMLLGCPASPPPITVAPVVVLPVPAASQAPAVAGPSSAPVAQAQVAQASPALCSANVAVSDTVVSPTCLIHDKMGGRTGTLQYPCDGDGAALLVLNRGKPIPAVVRGGELTATITTAFDWNDGCRWRAIQTARGVLADKVFVVEYREAPEQNPQACAAPCDGDGKMFLQ